jgi:hypothetical protein
MYRSSIYAAQPTSDSQLSAVLPSHLTVTIFSKSQQNLIRKGVYGNVDMSNQDDLTGMEHLDHCIDMLRQSIMVRVFAHVLPQNSNTVLS